MSIAGHLIVIGQGTWDRLPPDIQQIILEEAEKAGKAYIDDIDRLEEEAAKQIEALGGVIKPIPDEEMAKWHEAAPDLLQQWADSMKDKGEGERAQEAADFIREQTGS
jgi:TRAP-type C4-dicarboxylate transport system substrate-binding protein